MMASRDASASVRFRLASFSPRRPRLQVNATRTAAPPRIQKLWSSEAALTRMDASTAPPTIAAIELASNSPATRPSVSLGITRASTVSADHLAADEPGAADHRDDQRDGQRVAARVDELAGARECPRAHHDERQLPARGQLTVERRADQPADARGREQEAVPAGAQAERPVRVDDQLNGLGAIGELDHGDEDEERKHERRDASRPQPGQHAGPRGAAPGGRDLVPAQRGDEQRGHGESGRVGEKGRRRGRDGEQDRADRRADHDAQVLDGMQQRVGGADPRFAHQPREQRQRRRALGAPRRGGQRGQSDHQRPRGRSQRPPPP